MKQTETFTKNDIKVDVQVKYMPEESDPNAQSYLFGYTIRISNLGAKPTQLISRHWIITDGWGRIEEVKGSGVIGKQPKILPGDTFEYTSFCPLTTPTGSMRGFYEMVLDTGESLSVEIPPFYLIEPNSFH